MSAQRIFATGLGLAISLLAIPVLTGCDLPGRPQPGPEVPRPDAVTSFDTLYGENCAGCHGKNGDNGAATNLANPEYQALIDDASLRAVIANGEKETLMPGFSVRSGGTLTEGQVDVIVQGMRARWKKENAFGGETPPPYKASHAGDETKGEAVYAAACARCHGETAQHPGSAGSILDGSFLALINEQTVRTTVIAGRPDIGEPDWRNHIPGRAMTDDEITDVSAWLIAKRPARPGQPYPNAKPVSQLRGEAQPQTARVTQPTKPRQP
jgi:cytochrome c oxidase cbb3-type subunit 3/ubiquinol-cytochrome c reductase cytochrome c subunit